MEEKILLCCDPGKKNFGFSFVSNTRGVLGTGYLDAICSFDYDLMPEQVAKFSADFEKQLAAHPIDYIVAERFMNRGRGGRGAVGEYINVMLGIVALIALKHNKKVFLMSAALWKKYMLNQYETHEMPVLLQDKWTVHECDSIGMGVFVFEMYHEEDVARGTMIPLILGQTFQPTMQAKVKKTRKKKVSKKEALAILKEASKGLNKTS